MNILILMVFHHGQSEETTKALHIINLIFMIIFGIEIVLKALAKGKKFFTKFSGIYQILVILIAYMNLILQPSHHENIMNHFTDQDYHSYRIFNAVAKAMQFTLIIFVLNEFKKVKQIFKAIKNIMPILWSMVGFTFLYLYIYTIISMNIFSYLKPQMIVNGIDVHFRTFFKAM